MNHFDLAQEFIERCARREPVEQLTPSFEAGVARLGFRYFACCSHVDPLHPPRHAVVLHNYPQEWVRAFSELDFYEIDPVFHYASRTMLPFFWDADAFRAELTPPQQEILAEAARFGIEHGYTIPIHSPRGVGQYRASCSVVPESAAPDMSSYFAVQLMSFHLYAAAGREMDEAEANVRHDLLSRRERQCLELAAQGKSDWVTGRILGISERTVHNHIESAKRRLQVATRVQAIIHALASQQISLGDVIRAESSERRAEAKAPTKNVGL